MRRFNTKTALSVSGVYLGIVIGTIYIASLSWQWLMLYMGMSVASYGLFFYDKWMAQKGGWRIPEKTLLIFALLGGWMGALIAQQQFRHKTQKQPFKTLLWLCLMMNILIFFAQIFL